MIEYSFVEGTWPQPEIRVKPKNEQEVSLPYCERLPYLRARAPAAVVRWLERRSE